MEKMETIVMGRDQVLKISKIEEMGMEKIAMQNYTLMGRNQVCKTSKMGMETIVMENYIPMGRNQVCKMSEMGMETIVMGRGQVLKMREIEEMVFHLNA